MAHVLATQGRTVAGATRICGPSPSDGPALAPRASSRRHTRALPAVRAATEVVEASQQTPPSAPKKPAPAPRPAPITLTPREERSLGARYRSVASHFPTALGVDDFMARVEVALAGFGFTGENSIAVTNLCRDEVTTVLKDKIETVFGSSFNINGLGGVLTCGATGMGAGFSHSPISNGKEHYVFFAFPHIGINSAGEVGAISRPGRAVKSCACGALQKCLIQFKAEGYTKHCKVPGVHDPSDPEYSILKQRLARRVRYEELDPTQMDLVDMTHVAERTITNDIEYLIEKCVDFKKANIAVVTGVQIHNWATELSAQSGVPSLEFVAPAKVYVVNDGAKYHIDLTRVPTSSPRQLTLFANASLKDEPRDADIIIQRTAAGVLKEVPLKYLTQRLGVTKAADITEEEEEQVALAPWQAGVIANLVASDRDPAAPTMESMTAGERFNSFKANGGVTGFLGLSGLASPWPPGV